MYLVMRQQPHITGGSRRLEGSVVNAADSMILLTCELLNLNRGINRQQPHAPDLLQCGSRRREACRLDDTSVSCQQGDQQTASHTKYSKVKHKSMSETMSCTGWTFLSKSCQAVAHQGEVAISCAGSTEGQAHQLTLTQTRRTGCRNGFTQAAVGSSP